MAREKRIPDLFVCIARPSIASKDVRIMRETDFASSSGLAAERIIICEEGKEFLISLSRRQRTKVLWLMLAGARAALRLTRRQIAERARIALDPEKMLIAETTT